MQGGILKALFRYPVKSMAGERHGLLTLGARGVTGDRAWAVRDEQRGGIRGGKRFPPLMQCAASYDRDPPDEGSIPAQVELPDGRRIATDDPDAARLLSELVGSPVTVWPLLPADRLDHYRRGAPVLDDMEAEFRRMFGRTADEPLPDLSAFPDFLREFESPPGTYFDAFPILIMTTESLEHMQASAPDHVFDVARFRPNLLIETGSSAPFPERDWPGRRLRIGSVELDITMACPRCVMTTYGFGRLPEDPGVMRSLMALAGGDLGVYANVVSPGQVQLGDAVELV